MLYEVVTPKQTKFVWSDKRTSAKTSVSIFEVDLNSLPDDCFVVGQVGVPFHAPTIAPSSFVVLKIPDKHRKLIRPPARYEMMWNDKKSRGSYDATFWRVIPPAGYVALGDIVVHHYDEPNYRIHQKYACFRKDLLRPGVFKKLWTDQGSGATLDGSLWEVECDNLTSNCGLAGFFKVNKGWEIPNVDCCVLPLQVTANNCDKIEL